MEDDTSQEAIDNQHDSDTIYVPSELPYEATFTENEAAMILANYNRARHFLQKQKLNRGYFRTQSQEHRNGKGKGNGKEKGKYKC